MGTQEDIQQRINSRLTIDANLLEGGFSQDIIGSVSYELANIYDTELDSILDKAFVSSAQGDDLDNVAADYGMTRRAAQAATVYLEITGNQGAVINSTVKATYNNLTYTVQEYKVISATGTAVVKAVCDTVGAVGNVPANTITEFLTTYDGLLTVTNPEAAYDGFDREETETFRERIIAYLAEDASNCNEAQYRQWALEVTGVDRVVILPAEEIGAGKVGVNISAINSEVSDDLKKAVYDYISEKQFINATVVVNSLETVPINIDATVEIQSGYTISGVIEEFTTALSAYLDKATNIVSYFRCSDILFECSGVTDVTDFKLNDGTESIEIANTEIAKAGDINVVAG